jgi:hypothetical protein
VFQFSGERNKGIYKGAIDIRSAIKINSSIDIYCDRFSLKTLAEAAFYGAWLANISESKQDPETYQRTFDRYLKRFKKMPPFALRTVARAASAEANKSIKAYERIGSLPPNVTAPVELPVDAKVLAELIAKYKAKSG